MLGFDKYIKQLQHVERFYKIVKNNRMPCAS
jgi:hypothetical protein